MGKRQSRKPERFKAAGGKPVNKKEKCKKRKQSQIQSEPIVGSHSKKRAGIVKAPLGIAVMEQAVRSTELEPRAPPGLSKKKKAISQDTQNDDLEGSQGVDVDENVEKSESEDGGDSEGSNDSNGAESQSEESDDDNSDDDDFSDDRDEDDENEAESEDENDEEVQASGARKLSNFQGRKEKTTSSQEQRASSEVIRIRLVLLFQIQTFHSVRWSDAA